MASGGGRFRAGISEILLMPIYTQTGRLISLTTPLGKDIAPASGLTGHEAISNLFNFHLKPRFPRTPTSPSTRSSVEPFTLHITQSDERAEAFQWDRERVCLYGQGEKADMTRYEIDVVPKLWTWG